MSREQVITICLIALLILMTALLYANRQAILGEYFLWRSYRRAVSLFATNPVMSEDVVFLGDSITEAFPLDEMFPDVATKNRGISGDTTAGVLRRLDQVTSGQPRKIFLMIGTNDLSFGYRKETVVANYEEILRHIKRETPDSQVFVQSILPQYRQYAADINFVNGEIAARAEKYGFVYVDLFPAFADEAGGIRPEFSNDNLHLLHAGYEQWQELLTPYIYGGGN